MLTSAKDPDVIRLLILIRHSHPKIDPNIPSNEWHLSKKGRSLCKRLAERLAPYKADVLISSHEPKALETAQIISTKLNIPCEAADGLHEHQRKYVPFTNQKHFETKVASFFDQPDLVIFGEESADQAYQRFSTALINLIKKYPYQTLMVVSHGTVISLWVARKIGLPPYPF